MVKFPKSHFYPAATATLAALLFASVLAKHFGAAQTPLDLAAPAPTAPPTPNAADLSQLGVWHLFGEASVATPSENNTDTPAELKLRGVFYLSGTKARAIIETAGQTQKTYQSNDTLAGGGIVQTIAPDSVTLLINNQLSTLPLSRPEPDTAEAAAAEPTP